MKISLVRFVQSVVLLLLIVISMNTSTSSQTNVQGEMLTLRGKRIYVEVRGPANAPALLYLHGGPGAGSYDFTLYQGERLSGRLRLVVMDQRGVLRSDPLANNEAFGLQDIIEDCEALRKHLGIRRWSVLSHSFGGIVAVRYALAYPDAVEKLLLESPSLDVASSCRSQLRGAAIEYRALGKPEIAEECLRAAEAQHPMKTLFEDTLRLTNALGARRNNLYVHGAEKDFFERLVAGSPFPPELWKKGSLHQHKIFAEGLLFESLLPRLSEIKCPTLLIKGKYDWVTADDQVAAFRREVKLEKVVVFKDSSHFVHVEEPARYASVVTRFVTARQ
jgi:proline iminopeptidase